MEISYSMLQEHQCASTAHSTASKFSAVLIGRIDSRWNIYLTLCRVSMATIRPRGWQLNILNKTKITT